MRKRLLCILLVLLFILTLLLSNETALASSYFGSSLLLYIVTLAAVFTLIIYAAASAKIAKLEITTMDIALIAFGGYLILSAMLHSDTSFWNDKLLRSFFLIIAYVLARSLSSHVHFTNTFLITVVVVGLMCSLHGVIQYLSTTHNKNAWLAIKGTFGNSALYACFLAATLPSSYCLRIQKQIKYAAVVNKLAYLNIVTSILMLVVTNSRAAMIAGIMSVIFVLSKRQNLLKQKAFWIITLLMILFSSLFFISIKPNSLKGRMLVWNVSAMMCKESPITGLGIGQYAHRYNDYQAAYFAANNTSEYKILASNTYYAFNEYIEVLVEEGAIGLALILTVIVVSLLRVEKKSDMLLICYQSTVLTILTFALFSYPFSNTEIGLMLTISLAFQSGQYSPIVFKREIPTKTVRLFFVVLILITTMALFYTGRRFMAMKAWQRAYNMIGEEKTKEALKTYEQVFSELQDHGEFLFNYGAELSEARMYRKSIFILNIAKQYFNHIDLYIFLGRSYEGAGDYKEAERCYRYASLMIPNRFVPKYLLAKLYIREGDTVKAIETAKEILNTQVKVRSSIVTGIRKEMEDFISVQKPSL